MFLTVVEVVQRDSDDGGAAYDCIPVAAFFFDPEDGVIAPVEEWALQIKEWCENERPDAVFGIVATENVEDDLGFLEAAGELDDISAELRRCVVEGRRYSL